MNSADLIARIKKQPIGFGCGILCIILGALLYFRSGKIAESQAEYDAKSIEATNILANVRNAANLPEQVAEIQALTKDLEGRLMRAGQLAVNQQYFYKLEAENEVKLLDARQGSFTKSSKTLYTGVPYTVAVQGTYQHILAFLRRLENGRHFCRFLSFNFTKGGGSNEQTATAPMTLTLNLEILGQP